MSYSCLYAEKFLHDTYSKVSAVLSTSSLSEFESEKASFVFATFIQDGKAQFAFKTAIPSQGYVFTTKLCNSDLTHPVQSIDSFFG